MLMIPLSPWRVIIIVITGHLVTLMFFFIQQLKHNK